MARMIEESILSETDNDVTIRFTRRNGRYIDRTVPKVENMDTEALLRRWHRRMMVEELGGRVRWKRPE